MLSYSGTTVLSFANKVVKVQPRKFVRSLYGVPRTLQYYSPTYGPKFAHAAGVYPSDDDDDDRYRFFILKNKIIKN